MNRKDRRKVGFTEPRFRKMDLPIKVGWYDSAFKFYAQVDAYKLGNSEIQRTQRLDGKPRRWQAEKARRRIDQIERLTSDL